LRAFAQLQEERPDLRLRLTGRFPDALRAELLGPLPSRVRSAIEVLGVGRIEDQPRLYREASVMVLPSMWEAQGMVTLESFASGTPVALTRHGAFPELCADPGVGALFDPETDGFETQNASGLVKAIREALLLAQDPATIQRCRRVAERYSWDALGPRYENVHRRVIG